VSIVTLGNVRDTIEGNGYCEPTNLGVKPKRINARLRQDALGNFHSAGAKGGVVGDGVLYGAAGQVLVVGNRPQWQAIDDLAVRLQRQIGAEDVADRAIKHLAMLVVENHVCFGHGC